MSSEAREGQLQMAFSIFPTHLQLTGSISGRDSGLQRTVDIPPTPLEGLGIQLQTTFSIFPIRLQSMPPWANMLKCHT